jgi:Ca2+-binding RTX toxin-like protein
MGRARTGRAKIIAVATSMLAVALLSGLVVGSSSGAGSRTCLERRATILGTAGNDNIYGTNGSDVIAAGAGNDQIHGLGGDDYLCGEGGRDIVTGGSGDDQLYGGQGGDALFGGSGDDFLSGGKGADQLEGGSGDDYLQGDGIVNSRGDSCDGGDGLDTALDDCESKRNVP